MAHDPREPVRLVPSDQADRQEGDQRAYYLKPPSVYDRARYRRAMSAQGAVQRPSLMASAAEMRRAIEELITGDEQAGLLALVDAYEAALQAMVDDQNAETISGWLAAEREIAPVADQVRRIWPAFAELEAQRVWYQSVAGIEGARLFLTDWDNGPCPLNRGKAGVPDAVLTEIPDGHLVEIGMKVQDLMEPPEARAKNSDSPSPSPSTGASSTASNPQPPTTRSKGTNGASRRSAGQP